MSFDEIQSIWDSQKSVADSVDRDSLTKWIQNRNQSFVRIVGLVEFAMAGTLLFLAAMFMRDPLVQGHDMILLVPGALCLFATGFVWSGRVARRKRELRYGQSLSDIVEQSIDAVNYQMRRMRSFLWWFAGPSSVGLIIALFIVDDSKRHLLYLIFIPAFLVCMALSYWQVRREIAMKLMPEKKRLEKLKSSLLGE